VKAVGMSEAKAASGQRLISPGLSTTLIGMMHHVVATVPFYRDRTLIKGYDVGGKTGTAQIWDPSLNKGRGGWKKNLFNYSFMGYIAREKGKPDLVVALRIEEGKPFIHKLGQLEMPVMSFELFRRIAHDAITTPDLLGERTVPPDATTASR
jgi:cell division protein FtsI/penicillin-binding protein 2